MFLLRTFGSLTLAHAATGTAFGAPRRKPLALLALVADAGTRGAAREWVVATLWPDLGEARGRRALAQTLYALRKELGTDVLTGDDRLGVDSSRLSVDANEFDLLARPGRTRRELERAVALYAGPYLDGVYFPGSAEFEQWVDPRRAGYARAYQGVLRELAHLASSAGDLAGAITWLEQAAREFPLDSDVAAALAEAYVRAGRRGQADSLIRAHLDAIREELGGTTPAVAVLAAQLQEVSASANFQSRPAGDMAASAVGAAPERMTSTTTPDTANDSRTAERRIRAAAPDGAPLVNRGARRSLSKLTRTVGGVLVVAVGALTLGQRMSRMAPSHTSDSARTLVAEPARTPRTLDERTPWQPNPGAQQGVILVRIRPPSTGDARVDRAAAAVLRAGAEALRQAAPYNVIGPDSAVAIERRVRSSDPRLAVDENAETYAMLKASGAHVAFRLNAMLYQDTLRFFVWLSRRAALVDYKIVIDREKDILSRVPVGERKDGLESFALSTSYVFVPTSRATTAAPRLAEMTRTLLTDLSTCRRDSENPSGTPWCWAGPGELRVADIKPQRVTKVGSSAWYTQPLPPAATSAPDAGLTSQASKKK
jgi:DNA-binding SARP family transcriptional activator